MGVGGQTGPEPGKNFYFIREQRQPLTRSGVGKALVRCAFLLSFVFF